MIGIRAGRTRPLKDRLNFGRPDSAPWRAGGCAGKDQGERLIACRCYSTDPRTDVAPGVPEAAICVQDVDVQCVLQFTLIDAACCALHRRTSRVIHRLELCQVLADSSFGRPHTAVQRLGRGRLGQSPGGRGLTSHNRTLENKWPGRPQEEGFFEPC